MIPARYQSTRLPGKPLAKIQGKPMIQWVVEQARQSTRLSQVLVATDDERILNAVHDFGGNAVMTSADCASGSDRAAEAVREIDCDIVVNIQGDEPFIPPKSIDLAADVLLHDSAAQMGTLIKRIFHAQDLVSPNTAKVIIDLEGRALYFSRSPIPFCRDVDDPAEWIKSNVYYKHIGIYSYRKTFLRQMTQWAPSRLEMIEKLEQLRALEHGAIIRVAETDVEAICVDTPEDLERAEAYAASLSDPE